MQKEEYTYTKMYATVDKIMLEVYLDCQHPFNSIADLEALTSHYRGLTNRLPDVQARAIMLELINSAYVYYKQ